MREPEVIGHPVKFSNTIMGLIKKGWWEIPEVMGSSCIAILGIVIGGIGAYNYMKRDGDVREYRKVFMIMRPSDERASRLKNPVFTQY